MLKQWEDQLAEREASLRAELDEREVSVAAREAHADRQREVLEEAALTQAAEVESSSARLTAQLDEAAEKMREADARFKASENLSTSLESERHIISQRLADLERERKEMQSTLTSAEVSIKMNEAAKTDLEAQQKDVAERKLALKAAEAEVEQQSRRLHKAGIEMERRERDEPARGRGRPRGERQR